MKATSSRPYFNRELSWLRFNTRVLEEAENAAVPLFERLRFLSISASNLDEFYMVRVAGLRTQVLAGMSAPSDDGFTPARQLEKIEDLVAKIVKRQQKCWQKLKAGLDGEGFSVVRPQDLGEAATVDLEAAFETQVLPLLTPLAVDPAHPFPFMPNLGFGMVLSLDDEGVLRTAIVPVPSQVGRFVELKTRGKKRRFVLIEDVIRHFNQRLFPDTKLLGAGVFRITRDSDISVDDEAEDLVRHFEFLLKKRRRGRVIRLQVSRDTPKDLVAMLIDSFECWDEAIQDEVRLLGMSDLSQLIQGSRPDLLFPPFVPRFPERIREYDGDHFAAIAAKDIIVHHPYEEFDVVVGFLEQAALDPNVVAIKQTLYRTSDDSPIVRALIEAAERGKAVTALVELKARFDEESNLRWARDLERAGAHVVYGFIDYKTHAKCSLVVRREGEALRTYAHLGTGNYHAQNAKIYTDLALFTADPALGRDVGRLFNYVTSYSEPRDFEKLVIAPLALRGELLSLIAAETATARAGGQGAIWAKLNSLVDTQIIDALYAASQAGVEIDLVVRGICCLRPGVPGLSETIRVRSIVGRFLEHSRIAVFGNGAALPNPHAKIFVSSADWMPRNLDRRVEAFVPIEDPTVRRQVQDQVMVANLKDNVNSWVLDPTGEYRRLHPERPEDVFSAHAYFMRNPSLSGRGRALVLDAPAPLDLEAPQAARAADEGVDEGLEPQESPPQARAAS